MIVLFVCLFVCLFVFHHLNMTYLQTTDGNMEFKMIMILENALSAKLLIIKRIIPTTSVFLMLANFYSKYIVQ